MIFHKSKQYGRFRIIAFPEPPDTNRNLCFASRWRGPLAAFRAQPTSGQLGLQRRLRRGPAVDWHLAKPVTRQNLRPGPVPARRFGQNQTMTRALWRVDSPIEDQHRFIDQMFQILKGIFEPLDFRQRAGHVHAKLEKCVAERYGYTEFGGQPTDPHHVRHLAVNVEHVGRARLHKLALAGGIEILT